LRQKATTLENAAMITYVHISKTGANQLECLNDVKSFGFSNCQHLFNTLRKRDSLKRKLNFITLFTITNPLEYYHIQSRQLYIFLKQILKSAQKSNHRQGNLTKILNDFALKAYLRFFILTNKRSFP
jgi:hypothetical protein